MEGAATLNPVKAIETMEASIVAPARAVNRLADLQLARHALPPSRLLMFGFSQGGMLAIRCGLARSSECAGVVSCSGHFWGAIEIIARPRTLLVVGEHELRNGQAMAAFHPRSVKSLREQGVAVDEFVVPGVGHTVSADAIDRVVSFADEVSLVPR